MQKGDVLVVIRQIYFRTGPTTIEADLAKAIALFKTLSAEDRSRAAVYMDGLAEMRTEWRRDRRPSTATPRPRRARR